MAISEEDMRYLNERFMTRSECEQRTDKTQGDIAGMRTDMAVMCKTLESIKKLLWGIGACGGGAALTYIVTKILGG